MIAPSHAAKIWLADGQIYLEFNSSRTDRKHAVHFPNNPDGLALALSILAARGPESTVATAGAPIQYDVEKLADNFLKNGGKIVRPKSTGKFDDKQRANARDVLRHLGLI